jgi:hypothetical protein
MDSQQLCNSATAYLAFRKSNSHGFAGIFSRYTKWRLHTQFPHCGIVIGDTLLHSTMKSGVHPVKFENNDEWVLFPTQISCEKVLFRFEFVKGTHYDWRGLLAFIVPFRTDMGKWLFCYELAHYLVKGEFPTELVTPETLLCEIFYAEGGS